MDEEINEVPEQQEQQAVAAIPLFCPNDGSVLVEGEKFGYPAWVCQSCTYWKIKL